MQDYIKKILDFETTTLMILGDELKDIIIKVKPLEDSDLLLRVVSETIHTKCKRSKRRFC